VLRPPFTCSYLKTAVQHLLYVHFLLVLLSIFSRQKNANERVSGKEVSRTKTARKCNSGWRCSRRDDVRSRDWAVCGRRPAEASRTSPSRSVLTASSMKYIFGIFSLTKNIPEGPGQPQTTILLLFKSCDKSLPVKKSLHNGNRNRHQYVQGGPKK